jgi:hypothetical protein
LKTFRDNAGRTWTVAVTVASIKRVRATAGVDLYGLVDDGFRGLAELLADPIRLVDVLYVLCQAEAERQGVTDEQFGEAMAGDAIDLATTAFLESFTEFFPAPKVRAGIARLIEASGQVRERMLDEMNRRLDAIDPDSEARRLIGSSGGSPALSVLTPDLSRSANST